MGVYRADASLSAKLRRRLVRLRHRRPATAARARPMVTFAFDDVPETAVTVGAPVLERQGVRGTFYVSAGLADAAGPVGRYAGREALQALAAGGHEIGCHTHSHLDCGAATGERVSDDMALNAALLCDWGVAAELSTFAYPYGDVGYDAKAEAGRRFILSRGLHPGLIRRGSDLNQAPAVSIEGGAGEARGRLWLQRAAAGQAWLILFAHAVEDQAAEFAVARDTLARLVDVAQAQGVDVVTAAEGARRMNAGGSP